MVRGQKLQLRPTEFRILALLTRNYGSVVTNKELFDHMWGDQEGSFEGLQWYIASVRRKLAKDPDQPSVIEMVSRMGYRYTLPDNAF